MKVIDLLNKIANGEEVPEKIKFKDSNVIYKLNKYNKYIGEYMNNILILENIDIEHLNDEVEIIEDTPKEDKKIEDKIRFQCSQIPSWFDIKEVIRVVNINFEKQQEALYEIIDKINGE